MATMAELTWQVNGFTRDGKRGLRIRVTSRPRPIEKLLGNKRAYYNHFMYWLKQAGKYAFIDLYIDSEGGSVHSACGMVRALAMQGWKGKDVRILINGRCDSAATLLLKLYAPVYITETGSVYIHMPSRVRYVKSGDGYREKETSRHGMETTAGMFEGAYLHRMKRNGEKFGKKSGIRAMMEKGHRFGAREAVAVGLCDGIMSRETFDRG